MNSVGAARLPAMAILLRYWGPVVAWALVISTMSGDPFSAQNTHRFIDPWLRYFMPDLTPEGFRAAHWWIRKTAHFVEFFILGWLAFFAWRRGRSPAWRLRWAVSAVLFVVVCALLDEFRQSFVPSRGASLYDSGIDTLGGIASQLFLYAWYRFIRRTPSHDTPP